MEVFNELNLVNHCVLRSNWCTPSSAIGDQKSAPKKHSRGRDIFSPSKFELEHDLNSKKTETDYSMDCSPADIVRKVLKKSHLKKESFDIAKSSSIDGGDIAVGAGGSLSCKVCCSLDNPLNMLICDLCDGAFHASCFKPRIKKIPTDEWYCKSCMKKKPKPLLGVISSGESSNGIEEKYMNVSSGRYCPISFMLEDTEPYTTGVRIGKAFQADVPEWAGPISNGRRMTYKRNVADLSKGDNDNSSDDWHHPGDNHASYAMKAEVQGDKEDRMIIENDERWKSVWANKLLETLKHLGMALIEAFSQRFDSEIRTMQNKYDTIRTLSSYIHMTELMVACRSLGSGMTNNEEFIAMFSSIVDCWTGKKNVVHNNIATVMPSDPASQFKHDVNVLMTEAGCDRWSDSQVQGTIVLEGKTMEKLKNCQQNIQDSKTKACRMENSIGQLWKKRRIV